jgi:nicotinamidase-related amidase
MTSAPVRDPLSDHLITPQNAAFLLIDYQPSQLAGVRSMDRDLLVKNAVSTVKTIKTRPRPSQLIKEEPRTDPAGSNASYRPTARLPGQSQTRADSGPLRYPRARRSRSEIDRINCCSRGRCLGGSSCWARCRESG